MRLPKMPVTHQSTPGKSLAPEIIYISRNMWRWIEKAKRFSSKMKRLFLSLISQFLTRKMWFC